MYDLDSAEAVLGMALEGSSVSENAAKAFVGQGAGLIAEVRGLREAITAYHAAFIRADAAPTWTTFATAAEACVAARQHMFGPVALPYTPAEPSRLAAE